MSSPTTPPAGGAPIQVGPEKSVAPAVTSVPLQDPSRQAAQLAATEPLAVPTPSPAPSVESAAPTPGPADDLVRVHRVAALRWQAWSPGLVNPRYGLTAQAARRRAQADLDAEWRTGRVPRRQRRPI